MKKIFFVSLFCFIFFGLNAQTSTLKISTSIAEARFKVFLDGNCESLDYTKNYILENIKPGNHNLIVSFDSDTVAVLEQKVKFKAGKTQVFVVEKRDNMAQKIGNAGRALGRLLEVEGAGNKKKNLYEVYFLRDLSQEQLFKKSDKE